AERAALAAAAAAEPGRARPDRDRGTTAGENPTVIDGKVGKTPDPQQPHRTTAQEREQKAAAQVRAAWSPERAERVIGCQAWGMLAHQLDQVEQQGHDVQALLRGVPAFVHQAHTPAAFAFRSIEDRLDGLVDLDTQRSSDTRPPTQPTATPATAQNSTTASGPGEHRETAQAPDPTAAAAGAAPDRRPPDASAGAVQTSGGDGRAAQVAAQAYPISTKDAVASAAEKTEADAAADTGSGPAGARSASVRSGPQQTRQEPRER
ncbi:hypothetical protein AB0J56_48265, partial [Actinoplanes xinjiangensis]